MYHSVSAVATRITDKLKMHIRKSPTESLCLVSIKLRAKSFYMVQRKRQVRIWLSLKSNLAKPYHSRMPTEHYVTANLRFLSCSRRYIERWWIQSRCRWLKKIDKKLSCCMEPRDARSQSKSCYMLHSCTEIAWERACNRWTTLKVTQGHQYRPNPTSYITSY